MDTNYCLKARTCTVNLQVTAVDWCNNGGMHMFAHLCNNNDFMCLHANLVHWKKHKSYIHCKFMSNRLTSIALLRAELCARLHVMFYTSSALNLWNTVFILLTENGIPWNSKVYSGIHQTIEVLVRHVAIVLVFLQIYGCLNVFRTV